MVQPVLENLESRQLLSVLAAGQAQLFDLNHDGANDAVLVNTGASAINYTYSGGGAIDRVDITANGASFATNAAVAAVGDTDPDADYTLTSAQIGVSVKYQCKTYKAAAGDTTVVEGAIGTFQLGAGDLLAPSPPWATSTRSPCARATWSTSSRPAASARSWSAAT